MITLKDFKKLEIRIGKILSAQKVEGADKLLRLEVDIGKKKRQLVAGIAQYYEPEELIHKQIPIYYSTAFTLYWSHKEKLAGWFKTRLRILNW